MASKRKSTIPCMIPSKSKHGREEIILGSLPELLPTIPEDSILSISGEEAGHFSHSKAESGTEVQKGGTYSCPKCRFESRDLNYFLDHMHNCHLDFRAQPTFYCLDCGVSVVRFEALALHNATAHPKIMEGLVTASLTVNKRDGVTTVEQSLFTDNGENYRESGISLPKRPIAKMMKAKGEHKKIVVSHTVEVRKIDTGKDVEPSMLINVPELQNGALSISAAPAMPRTTVNHAMNSIVSNQVFHQHTPSLYSPPSSNSNKDLPKVMIPLSSIPTYDAAMDTSSFLKTSFGKFPYPTKAELCYLTVVSEFPEEQIKLWFTAQRLKQGISWSPEEIEEARRKMFNTVFQGGAPQKQPASQQHANHIVTHHTITAHPGSKVPSFQMAKLPYASLKTRPVGATVTQAGISTNPHVTRVSYSTPAVPAEIQSALKASKVLTKSIQPPAEPVKTNGLSLDAAGSSGCVSSTSNSRSNSSSSSCSSSSSISSYSSSLNSSEAAAAARRMLHDSSPTKSANSTATCCLSISNNDEHCVADTAGKPNVKNNGLPIGMEPNSSNRSQTLAENTSKSANTCNNHSSGVISPKEPAHNATGEAKQHNSYAPQSNSVSISGEFASAACNDSAPNHTSRSPTESTSTSVITKSSSSIFDEARGNQELPMKGMSILQQLIKEEESYGRDRSCPELKLDPFKISFKRTKVSEQEADFEGARPENKSEMSEVFPLPWGNKTPQQLHVLRQVFSNTRWPSSQQYEELSLQTGLPKSEVVRWFSDSRYSHKNGQLRWLETYQRPAAELEEGRGFGGADPDFPRDSPAAKRKLVEQDVNRRLEGEAAAAALSAGQRMVWQDSYSPLLGLIRAERGGERGRAKDSAQQGALQGGWPERAEDHHQQPGGAAQSLMEQQTDASQARERPRMELLEV